MIFQQILPESNTKKILYAIASGLLLGLAWCHAVLAPLVFVGFVPLLLIEKSIYDQKGVAMKYVFRYAYLSFLIWNVISTWWISLSTPFGGAFSNIVNSLFMIVPFLLFHYTRTILKNAAYFSFILFWVSFEYLHLNWDFAWPWLNLGNVFSFIPTIIQWYEYSGTLGGTLWVLLVNLILFFNLKRFNIIKGGVLFSVLIIPIYSSFRIASNLDIKGKSIEVVSVQPSIDPYEEKFSHGEAFMPYSEQVDLLMRLSINAGLDSTSLVLWPETAIQGKRLESYFKYDQDVSKIIAFCSTHKKVNFLVGIETWNNFENEKLPEDVKFREDLGYYQNYNTAILVNSNPEIQKYYKSKFVPGVEKVPFKSLLGFLVKLIDFDGAGTYGWQNERIPFKLNSGEVVAPLICYESVFGEFVTGFVKNKAQLLTVITNDGWWGNTLGHQHHNLYARLRAIETRKWVVRSANTGISSFINLKGEEVSGLDWWKRGVLKNKVELNDVQTFYVENGDQIGRVFSFGSVLIILVCLVRNKIKKY